MLKGRRLQAWRCIRDASCALEGWNSGCGNPGRDSRKRLEQNGRRQVKSRTNRSGCLP